MKLFGTRVSSGKSSPGAEVAFPGFRQEKHPELDRTIGKHMFGGDVLKIFE
jgi:hypothetical protein